MKQVRELAERILLSASLAEKLEPMPKHLADDDRGEPRRIDTPARPQNLQFAARRTTPAMPKPKALADIHKRAVAHHILANHELQALEVMAFVLLAFPDAHTEFRTGLVQIIRDEQRHTRMHADRGAELGVRFGDLPVNCYIWTKAQSYRSVLDYVAGLPLTFEGRNLDHTLELEEAFLAVGDRKSAAIVRAIHVDEIEHVRFGWEWLRRLKPGTQSEWEAYVSHLHWPIRAEKAVGQMLNRAPRREAGMSEEFLDRLAESGPVEDRSRTGQNGPGMRGG